MLAIVVGLLAIFIKLADRAGSQRSWTCWPSRPASARDVVRLTAEEGEALLPDQPLLGHRRAAQLHRSSSPSSGRSPSSPSRRCSATRRERIEQGLKDAEQARRDRESAEQERLATLAEARREANEILARAQKVAQETRDADIAATREELERMRERAAAEIEAEKHRAIADLRAEVADLALAAAGKVVGESMTDERQRRLVEEFLARDRPPGTLAQLMARPTTAARRYAEAAFELAVA